MKIVLIPERLKEKFKEFVNPIVQFFVRYKLNPNFLTSISLILCIGSAYQFGKGSLRLGAFILLAGGFFDMIDGAVARASNRVTKFGALYDSTLDRYAEIVVFLGLLVFFIADAADNNLLQKFYVFTIGLGIGGSLMVSYVRARAEGLGFECKVGIMQRPERIVMLGLGALLSKFILVVVLVIIAIFANITAIQRIVHIWSHENAAKWKNLPPDVGHE